MDLFNITRGQPLKHRLYYSIYNANLGSVVLVLQLGSLFCKISVMLFMQLPHRPALTTPFKMSWADNTVDTSALTRHCLSLLLCNVQGFRRIFSLPAALSFLLSTVWHSVSRADSWPVAMDRMRIMKRFRHIWPILHWILWFFVYWLPPSVLYKMPEVQIFKTGRIINVTCIREEYRFCARL